MNQKILHYFSVAVVLFLSALFLFFYLSGRIDPYVAPEFRRWALAAGLGLAVLGLFNLVTARQAVACGHDHSHDHDHDHDDHDHSHGKEGGCDGGHDHDHSHDHKDTHEHDHGDDGGCCEYGHAHSEEEAEHHHHGDSPANVVMALVILTLPMLIAANYSVDRFSTEYAIRWGNITEKLHRMELMRAMENEKTRPPASAPKTPPAAPAAVASAADTPPTTGADAGSDDGAPGTTVATADMPPASAPVGADAQPGSETPGAGVDNADEVAGTDDDGWGEFTLEDLKRMVPQSEDGNFLLEVPQLFYTANDTELQRVLEGLPVETIAQVMPDSSADDATTPIPDADKRLRLFRMFIECCAADMRPLPVTIQFPEGIPEYEEMGWVKVIGKVRYEHVDGITTPIIDVKTMEATAEPMDMMVY